MSRFEGIRLRRCVFALQAPGLLSPLFCTLSPLITPEGQTCQTGLWWLSDVKQWLYREKSFSFFFSPCLISRDSSFHLQKFDRWYIVLWHSEWEDLGYVDQTKKACWSELLTPHPCFKLFSLGHPNMKQRLFLGLDWRGTKQKPLKSDDSFRWAFNALLPTLMYDEISSYWILSSTAAVKDLVLWSRKSDVISSKKLNLSWFTDSTKTKMSLPSGSTCIWITVQLVLFFSLFCTRVSNLSFNQVPWFALFHHFFSLFVHFVTRTAGSLSSVPLCSYNSYCSEAPLRDTIKERFCYFTVSWPVFSICSAWKKGNIQTVKIFEQVSGWVSEL